MALSLVMLKFDTRRKVVSIEQNKGMHVQFFKRFLPLVFLVAFSHQELLLLKDLNSMPTCAEGPDK